MVQENRNRKRVNTVALVIAAAISLTAMIGALPPAREVFAGGGGGRSGITEECDEEKCEVSMIGGTFTPETLKIRPGATVVWTNTEVMPHTVTSGFSTDGRDFLFDSGPSSPIGQGGAWEHKFHAAGTFDYFCRLQKGMGGQVIVAGKPVGDSSQLTFMLLMAVAVFGTFGTAAAIKFRKDGRRIEN